jgi:hypothetical protein
MKESFGAPPYGGGVDDWLTHDIDTLDILQREENSYEYAKHEAEQSG